MLKNSDRYNNNSSESHFTYGDYKQKVQKTANKDVTIFVSVFIVGLLIILGLAKVLSPNVDISIPTNEEYTDDDAETETSSIDERLKRIQMEDEDGNSNNLFTPELDEKVVIPKQAKKNTEEQVTKNQEDKKNESAPQKTSSDNKVNTKDTNTSKEVKQQTKEAEHTKAETEQPKAQIVNAKVVIGTYATEKQAEVAKTVLQDTVSGVNPIVKSMDGYYTLQVGSYSSKEKAQQAANNLIKSNLPARVITE